MNFKKITKIVVAVVISLSTLTGMGYEAVLNRDHGIAFNDMVTLKSNFVPEGAGRIVGRFLFWYVIEIDDNRPVRVMYWRSIKKIERPFMIGGSRAKR